MSPEDTGRDAQGTSRLQHLRTTRTLLPDFPFIEGNGNFVSGIVAQDLIADLNRDGVLDLTDFNLLISRFVGGCP